MSAMLRETFTLLFWQSQLQPAFGVRYRRISRVNSSISRALFKGPNVTALWQIEGVSNEDEGEIKSGASLVSAGNASDVPGWEHWADGGLSWPAGFGEAVRADSLEKAMMPYANMTAFIFIIAI